MVYHMLYVESIQNLRGRKEKYLFVECKKKTIGNLLLCLVSEKTLKRGCRVSRKTLAKQANFSSVLFTECCLCNTHQKGCWPSARRIALGKSYIIL
jgi:hypothetical protein